MDFGFSLPIGGALATPGVLGALARRGEELGFSFVSTGDHLIVPTQVKSRYPYSETGEFGDASSFLDQPTMLSFLAAATSTIRLVTGVLVVPYRNPVHTAKVLATIDLLSNGRLTVGCGVGWMREEFEALGAPPYEQRGTATDEYIRAFIELWTSDEPQFHGRYCNFSDVIFDPKPTQKPHPPIWIGGESPRALKRAAALGDAWFPIGTNPQHRLTTLSELRQAVDQLYEYAEDSGREPTDIDVAYAVGWRVGDETAMDVDRHDRLLTGPINRVEADLAALDAIGVHHLSVGLVGGSVVDSIEAMERFAGEIFPLCTPKTQDAPV